MRSRVRPALGVVAALFCLLALYNAVVPEDGCGLPVRAAFDQDDADCQDRSADNAGQALLWTVFAVPATLGYAAIRRSDDE